MLIMKRKSNTTRYNSFLPAHLSILKTPPSYLAFTMAISISVGIFIAIAWSYFGKLDVQATTQGKLIVSGRTQTIQAFELSRLQQIHVEDGQQVKQGDPLLSVKVLGVDQDIVSLHYQKNFHASEEMIHHALLNQQQIETSPRYPQLSLTEQVQAKLSYQTIKKEYETLLNEIANEVQLNRVNYQAR